MFASKGPCTGMTAKCRINAASLVLFLVIVAVSLPAYSLSVEPFDKKSTAADISLVADYRSYFEKFAAREANSWTYTQADSQPDTLPPSGYVTNPANNSTITPDRLLNVSGVSSDDMSGVSRVFVRVQRRDVIPKSYWNGTDWQTSLQGTFRAATLDSNGGWISEDIDLSQPGRYRITLKVRDLAGNTSTTQNPYSEFSVVQTDTTPPSGYVTYPANGSTVTSNKEVTISGTSVDDISGVSRVFVRVQRRDVNPKSYWNGTDWQSSLQGTFRAATLDSNGGWISEGIDLSQPGRYRVTLKVRDLAGNTSTTQNLYSEFSVVQTDITPPSGYVTYPANGSTVIANNELTISGTSVDDNSGVSRVFVRVQRRDVNPKSYWNGTDWQSSLQGTFRAATLDSNGGWISEGIDLSQPGSYRITLKVRDLAGNTSTSQNPYSEFSVQEHGETDYPGLIINLNTNQAALEAGSNNSRGLKFNLNQQSVLNRNTSFRLRALPNQSYVTVEGDFTETSEGYRQSASFDELNASLVLDYMQKEDYLEIEATLYSSSNSDKAWRLQLPLSIPRSNWVWLPNAQQRFPLDSSDSDPFEASRYPLTTLASADNGLAIAVPITSPAVVDYKRNDQGDFVIEFSLGTSPLTSQFPNSATVKLQLWRVDPDLGFRQALADQYRRNADVYDRRYSAGGAWQSGSSDRLIVQAPFKFHRHGNVFFSLDDSSALPLDQQIEIDKSFDQVTIQYLIPGQMSHVQLNELPTEKRGIDDFLALQPTKFPPQQFQKYTDLGLHKDEYRRALETSRVTAVDNEYELLIRETVVKGFDPESGELAREWRTMGNQVSFVVNPNPNLALDGEQGHGKLMISWVQNLISQYPELGGVYVDSLGLWGSYKNYRRDHFPFTALPLASDIDGNVYLPNAWGHFEFVKELSSLLHDNNMIVMGNISGLSSAELYFLMSLPDIGFSERAHTTNNSLSYALRAATGPRLLLNSGKGLNSPQDVESYVYSRLVAGIIPSLRGSYYALPEWVNTDEEFATDKGMPNYIRDKQLWDLVYQFTPQFSEAKWAPITYVTSESPSVEIERFEHASHSYLTVYNQSQTTSLTEAICLDKGFWPIPPSATALLTNLDLDFTDIGSCWELNVPLLGSERKLGIVLLSDNTQ